MKKITVPFFISHQGCPHTCSFCDQKTISGAVGALPDCSEILQKIAQWKDSANGRPLEVAFFGGTFTALSLENQEKLLLPLQALRTQRVVSTIRISTRPDCLDSSTVLRLKESGVTTIEVGVQSMDESVLQRAGRGHSAGEVRSALACIKEHGLAAGAQLMPGLPGDTLALARQSLRQVVLGGADFVRIYPVVVLAGTLLAQQFREGSYQPLSLDDGVAWCKVLLHDAMLSHTPVIRIGLQADEGLNRQTVLAGCWHPALGQLARSALYADLIESMLESMEGDEPCILCCHPSRISDCVGQNRRHMQRFLFRIQEIKGDEMLQKEEILLYTLHHKSKESIVSGLHY